MAFSLKQTTEKLKGLFGKKSTTEAKVDPAERRQKNFSQWRKSRSTRPQTKNEF